MGWVDDLFKKQKESDAKTSAKLPPRQGPSFRAQGDMYTFPPGKKEGKAIEKANKAHRARRRKAD